MEKINCYRVKIAQKGYILPSELGKYAGISDAEGFQLYQKLKEMLRPKGEIPFVTIVTVEAVNNYLGLNQDEIESMAEQELKEKQSADSNQQTQNVLKV